MTDIRRPFPYNGEENYIFVSYAHRDTERVMQILNRLVDDGYRIWFDEGILPGSEWDDNIAAHAKSCHVFIAFLTDSYINSNNCKDEMSFVRDLNKDRLLVYLDDLELPDGMKMRLNRQQAIYWKRYENNFEAGIKKLESAQGVCDCCAKQADEPVSEAPASDSTAPNADTSGSAASPIAQKKQSPITKVLFALVAVLLVAGIGLGAFFAGRSGLNKEATADNPSGAEISSSTENLSQEETEPEAPEPLINPKDAREVIVTLQPDDDYTLAGYNQAIELIKERMRLIAGERVSSTTVNDDQTLTLTFTGETLGSLTPNQFLRLYISRPINLEFYTSTSEGTKAIPLERDDILNAELLMTPDNQAHAAGIAAERPSIRLTLSEYAATALAGLVSENKLLLGQDREMGNYGYIEIATTEDPQTVYALLGENVSPETAETILFNWTNPPLEQPFYFTIQDDVNYWPVWEDPASTALPGIHQVTFEELDPSTPAFAFDASSSEMSAGEWLDAQDSWKHRLDALGQPYAFGVYDDHSVVIKTSGDRLSEGMLSLLANNYSSYTLVADDYELSYSLSKFVWEETADGPVVTAELMSFYADDLEAFTTEQFAQKDSMTFLLQDSQGMLLFGAIVTEPIEDGKIHFNYSLYNTQRAVDETDHWLSDLLSAKETSVSTISYRLASDVSAETRASFGVDYQDYQEYLDQFLTNLQAQFPELEMGLKNSTLWVSFHLPVDDKLVETGCSLSKEIFEAAAFFDSRISLTCYFIDEDDSTMERARIFFSYRPGTVYSSSPSREASIYTYGVMFGGRVGEYTDEFCDYVTNDPFFQQYSDEYSWH